MTISPTCFQELLDYRLFMASRDCALVTEATCKSEFGLGGRHWRILATVAENQGSTVNEISELSELDVFQTSRAIGQLTRQGLVKRGARQGNHRYAEVSLTAQGVDLHERMFARFKELNSSLTELMDPKMVVVLNDCLSSLIIRAKELRANKSQRHLDEEDGTADSY